MFPSHNTSVCIPLTLLCLSSLSSLSVFPSPLSLSLSLSLFSLSLSLLNLFPPFTVPTPPLRCRHRRLSHEQEDRAKKKRVKQLCLAQIAILWLCRISKGFHHTGALVADLTYPFFVFSPRSYSSHLFPFVPVFSPRSYPPSFPLSHLSPPYFNFSPFSCTLPPSFIH